MLLFLGGWGYRKNIKIFYEYFYCLLQPEQKMGERYVSCNIKGGLGNQLFQIFATMAYGMRTGRQFRFHFTDRIGNRAGYWHSFLKGLENYKINQNDFLYLFHYSEKTKIHQEPSYSYSEIPEYSEFTNVLLDGYYQSRNYFAGYEKEIMELLWGNRLAIGRMGGPTNIPRIGMHFRIGDYKHIQHCHPVMATSYYTKALTECLKNHGYYLDASQWKEMVEKVHGKEVGKIGEVLYLCEDSDIWDVEVHLSVLREMFPYLSFRRGVVEIGVGERECDRDWKEMVLLSGCDWFVIPNSTYSWWAATISSLMPPPAATEKSIAYIERGPVWVYYPSIWFGPYLVGTHDTQDLLNQEGWKSI